MAVDAWAQIGKRIHDDRLGDIDRYHALATMAEAAERRAENGESPPTGLADCLEALARDAERRLDGIHALGKPVTVDPPWPAFVRNVARCCREAGLGPTATGSIYDGAAPTWFQEFMAALDSNLLGTKHLIGFDRERDKQFDRDHRAFYAAVAAAMSGNRKPTKTRK